MAKVSSIREGKGNKAQPAPVQESTQPDSSVICLTPEQGARLTQLFGLSIMANREVETAKLRAQATDAQGEAFVYQLYMEYGIKPEHYTLNIDQGQFVRKEEKTIEEVK